MPAIVLPPNRHAAISDSDSPMSEGEAAPRSPKKLQWSALTRGLKDNGIKIVEGKNLADGIRVQAASVDDFRKLTAYLDGRMLAYHTYQLTEDKPPKVFRGIPDTIDEA